MRTSWGWVVAGFLVAAGAACGAATGPETGLAGHVRRGPINPVCQDGVPCDAPFAADFVVFRGSRAVAAFRSDTAGAFEVRLAPGDYELEPGADAPVPSPALQRRAVEVLATGITRVELRFDTFIR